MITIRLARPDDDDATVHQLLQSFRQEYDYQPQDPEHELEAPQEHLYILLAFADNEAVGMLAAQRCHRLAQGSYFLLLSDIYVPQQHRQKGVAKKLMNEAKKLARRLHCQGMSLMVPDFNIAALTTAARAGFTHHNELLLTFAEANSAAQQHGENK